MNCRKLAASAAIALVLGTVSCKQQARQVESGFTVCRKADGKHVGLIFGSKCPPKSVSVSIRPGTGFLGSQAADAINYDTAVSQSLQKTKAADLKAQDEKRQSFLKKLEEIARRHEKNPEKISKLQGLRSRIFRTWIPSG